MTKYKNIQQNKLSKRTFLKEQLLDGTGPPPSALGEINDKYVDDSTGAVWKKTSKSTWTLLTALSMSGSGGGGGGDTLYSANDALTSIRTVDQAGFDLVFDGATNGGFFSTTGELSNGYSTLTETGNNLIGAGGLGNAMAVVDNASLQAAVLFEGDLRPLGVVNFEWGAVFGCLNFNGDFGAGSFRASVDTTVGVGTTEVDIFCEVSAGMTGLADLSLTSSTAGSGNAQINIVSSAGSTSTNSDINIVALSNAAGTAPKTLVSAKNQANAVETQWVINEGNVQLVGNNGATTRFTIPDDFGATTYADDTAAGVGGVATGT